MARITNDRHVIVQEVVIVPLALVLRRFDLGFVRDDQVTSAFICRATHLGCHCGAYLEEKRAPKLRLDLETGSLTVKCSLQKVRRPEGISYDFLPPKTKSSHRVVPLNADMVRLLNLHRAKQQSETEKAGAPDNDLVFRTSNCKIIDPDNASTMVKSALKQSGMDHYRLQDLRHAFATLLFQN